MIDFLDSPIRKSIATFPDPLFIFGKLFCRLIPFVLSIGFSSAQGTGDLLINEVITDPRLDWSTTGFDGTVGGGAVDAEDQWIELFVVTGGLNISGLTIEMNDGTDASGLITAGGAFNTVNYVGVGSLSSTVAGDYIVLGAPNGSSMDHEVTVRLMNGGTEIDRVVIAAATGTLFSGVSTDITDESVCRIPDGQDTDIEADDFVKTRATLGANNSPTGVVLINEVVTDPQQDWSANDFDGTPGLDAPAFNDEWVELYIGTAGLNLTRWSITIVDGTPFSGDLTSRDITGAGAFQTINYVGTGSFEHTEAGDYLVLGNPRGSENISNSATITLTDPYGTDVDAVVIASGLGTGFTGDANSIADESVCRIPNGQDTDIEADDFVKTRATLGTNNSPTGSVLINEIVTDPQQDWSTNGFDGTVDAGSVTDVDEWMELLIQSSGLNLIKWNISLVDGTDFSGDLTEATSGAFQVVNYVGSGSFNNTVAGDYLILGNPRGAINNNAYIELIDPYGTVVDDVEFGDQGVLGPGAPDGASTGVIDESVFRVPFAADTDIDADDFQKGISSLNTENGVVYVDGGSGNDANLGTAESPLATIQAGINAALNNGTIEVSAGTYAESLTISSPLTLRGANVGLAGNDLSRTAETIIDPSSNVVAITIASDDVIIDGIQIGTDASTSNATTGIFSTGNTGFAIRNSIIHTNSVGLSLSGIASSTVEVSNNTIAMLGVEDPLNATTGSIGIQLGEISGDADVDITNNAIADAGIGIGTYSLNSSVATVIDGGNFTGCTVGVLPSNFNGDVGSPAFATSTLTIQNLTMLGFVTDADVLQPDTETGIYVVTAGSLGGAENINVSISNVDISGVTNGQINGASNNAGIIMGDFPDESDGAGIVAIISDSHIHDNENRGIFSTGADASTTVLRTLIENNGFDPFGSGGNFGFSVIARDGASIDLLNCNIINPASQISSSMAGIIVGSDDADPGDGVISITNSFLDANGNGNIAGTDGIDLSGNYFGTTDEATLISLIGTSNDFSPWLASGTDTDLITQGFQGDFSSLIVGTAGTQTTAEGRIEEGIRLVDLNGTVTASPGTYHEAVDVDRAVTLNGANVGITGSGSRGDESIVDFSTEAAGFTISSAGVVIDGFQIGAYSSASAVTRGISTTGVSDFTATNNLIRANSFGIFASGLSNGVGIISNNRIEMRSQEDSLNSSNPSFGIYLNTIGGTADLDLLNNDIDSASFGVFGYSLLTSPSVTISGGTITNSTKGVEVDNTDGLGGFSASNVFIENTTMLDFFGPHPNVVAPDAQAGVYIGTFAGGGDDTDVQATISGVDISGVEATETDYSAIYVADFNGNDSPLGVSDNITNTVTISDSYIHDNQNRGILSRGANAVTTVNNTRIERINVAGGVVFASGMLNINNSSFVMPATGSADGVLAQQGGIITVRESSFNLNGNVDGALFANVQNDNSGNYVDLSLNWLSSVDESTIQTLVSSDSVDFTPWLADGTDTDGASAGFQPDVSALYVGTAGFQTLGERTQEGHDLVADGGTINLLALSYEDTLLVSRTVSLDPVAGASITNITMDGGILSILADFTIDSLAFNSGVIDLDFDDGNRTDDPVLTTLSVVGGAPGIGSFIEGKVSHVLAAGESFIFPVGDEGAYRPVTLQPTSTATFEVSHREEAAPGDIVTDLVGSNASQLGGIPIESVLDFRYWQIDVTAGIPGNTDVTLEVAAADGVSNAGTLGMTRFNDTNWVEMTRLSGSGTGPYTLMATTSTFSPISVYSTNSTENPLPVELIYFTGARSGQNIKLEWATASEINSDYFQVQHSLDGMVFTGIGTVHSNGNTNQRMDYHFSDAGVQEQPHYYRLKMVDFDGSYEFSEIIQVSPDFSQARLLIYPNPAADRIQIEGVQPQFIRDIKLFNLNGQLLKNASADEDATIYLFDLPKGYYLLKVGLTDGSTFEGKLVKE